MAVATGTYTGTDVDNRQIVTGFKCSMVILIAEARIAFWITMPDGTVQQFGGGTSMVTDCLLHAANGFVVDKFDANNSAYDPYDWWAISE